MGQVGHPGTVLECPSNYTGYSDTGFVWGKLDIQRVSWSVQVHVTMVHGILRHRVCVGQVGHPGTVLECLTNSSIYMGDWQECPGRE